MSKVTAKARNKWNKEHYYRIGIFVPKGMKKKIISYTQKQNITFNQFVNQLLCEEIGISIDDWGFKTNDSMDIPTEAIYLYEEWLSS